MNYTDNYFVVFLCITFLSYYAVKSERLQVLILIFASLFFYSFNNPLLLIVFLSSWFITSVTSYNILTTNITSQRRNAFIGVTANLALLAFFKYKGLFLAPPQAQNLASNLSLFDWLIYAPLPIGISFYTFHSISLLVDTYRNTEVLNTHDRKNKQHHFRDTMLYLVFFPQLIAGPIIKSKDFFPQLSLKLFKDVQWQYALKLLILGFFLKTVIADNLNQQTYWIQYPYFQWKTSLDLLFLLYGYAAQIFADFAGYSLIAIGLAALFGYRLPQNFNFPYVSSSIAEFWRRWHISLSSWLREYLYVPLGGNKKGEFRTYINLIIVMILGGFWHGAAWKFALWGCWHGFGLAIERPLLKTSFYKSTHKLVVLLRIFLVFNFVCVGWLFFKLDSPAQVSSFLTNLAALKPGVASGIALLISIYIFAIACYHLASLMPKTLSENIRNMLYGFMLFAILTSMGPAEPFIYFQF